eukprot:gnl/TRDRNA2_/TRDRNA2_29161_c0_seq1.p1 gnl/TRDRNA2_/TRDRNA2_29161_c0~~gnl/TRDRNA2_/TRDRNA2_29161_c0_seq1.p1  ORF type:complete len:487 (-),score=79.33 gnl/TRDRNA2_/TRDRNA2_29161_c0_seq1:50-1510(-)
MSLSLAEWPDVLHIAILRLLGGAKNVAGYIRPYSELCRVCAGAVTSPCLWHEIDLKCYQENTLAPSSLLSLLRRYGRGVVERLSLYGLPEIDNATVQHVAELLADGPLRSLDLGGCPRLSGAALATLSSIPTLEELSAEGMEGMDDACLAALCAHCPRLTHLDVRYCEWLTDATALARHPGTWISLQLDGCFRLDLDCILETSCDMWHALEQVSLDGENWSSSHFDRLAVRCPRLRSLGVSFASELEPGALAALARLPMLNELTLKKATNLTDAEWAAFFLEHRRSHAGASAGMAAAEGCEDRPDDDTWRKLEFCGCENFADVAVASLAMRAQPALADLDLSWCWHLTDAGLRVLLAATPNIERLKLAGAEALTANGVAPCCRLARLEELDCTQCNSIKDEMLEFLHRLFFAVPGHGGDALPEVAELPQEVAHVAEALWSKRSRRSPRLRIKNYFGEFVENWIQMRPRSEVCLWAEPILGELPAAQ